MGNWGWSSSLMYLSGGQFGHELVRKCGGIVNVQK